MVNIDCYRKSCYSCRDGFRLRAELQLLEAIQMYDAGTYQLVTLHQDVFNQLVDGIKKGLYDRYNLYNEDIIEKEFGIADYQDQSIIRNLLFYEAASSVSVNQLFGGWKDEFFDKMDHGFLFGLKYDDNVLQKWLDSFCGYEDEILKASRSMEDRHQSLFNYCKDNIVGKSQDEQIGLINQFNNGDYVELPESVSALAYLLHLNKRAGKFVELLHCLKYFPIQGRLLLSIDDAAFCMEIMSILGDEEKVLHFLLRERFFNIVTKQRETLKKNAEDVTFPNKFLSELNEVHKDWFDGEEVLVSTAVNKWLKVFGFDECLVWYSHNERHFSACDRQFVQNEKQTLLTIKKHLFEKGTLTSINLKDKDLPSLMCYAAEACEKKSLDAVFLKELITAICKHIYEDSVAERVQISSEGFETLRTLYYCLKEAGVDGLLEREKFVVRTEGYNCDRKSAMSFMASDTYWLSCLVLQIEDTHDDKKFDVLIDLLFKQFSDKYHSSISDDYFAPFYICELLVCHSMKEKKAQFEKKLVTTINDLSFVLRVLSANEGEMDGELKNDLQKRVQNEWYLEKQLAMRNERQTKKIIDYLDNYLLSLHLEEVENG